MSLSPLRALARRYAAFGRYPGLHAEDASRLKIIHLFLIVAVLFSSLTGLVFLALGDPAVTWLCFAGVAIQGFELWLIRRRRYRAVKRLFAALFPVYLVVNVYLTGTFRLVGMLALPFVTLTLFLFRKGRVRWGYVAAYTSALVAGFALFRWHVPPFPVHDEGLVNTVGIFLSLTLQVSFLNLYIDEMRLNRRHLLASERRWRTLFHRTPVPLIIYEGGRIVDCNRATVDILGADRKEDLVGRPPNVFSPPRQPDGTPSAEAGRALDERVRAEGTLSAEWTHRRLDGEDLPVELTIASVDGGMVFGIWTDLRERKRQEAEIQRLLDSLRERNGELEAAMERLQRQENATRQILENALDAVVGMDADGRITRWNRRAEELFGWPHDTVIGRLMADVVPAGRFGSVLGSGMERYFRTGSWSLLDTRLEIEARSADGRIFPVELTMTASGDRDRPAFTAFLRDLSDRKQAEEARQRDLEVAEAVNEFAHSLFRQRTEEDVLWDLARNCVQRLGFRECAIYMMDDGGSGLSARAAHGPENPIDLTQRKPRPVAVGEGIVGSVARTGKAEIVADTAADRRYIDDGRLGRCEIAVPIGSGDLVFGVIDSEHPDPGFFGEHHLGVLTVVASLVAHRLAHLREQAGRMAELQRQRAFYEDILNGIPADIAVMDKDHRYLFLNPLAVRSAEMRRWLIGKTDFDYVRERRLPEGFARQRQAVFQRVMATGHSLHWEDRFERDGKEEFILRRLSPVIRDGEVRFVVGYGTDITRIKEAEAVIRDHNDRLRAEVDARTRELAAAIEELRRSNADLESFASAASHDLQEPLRMVTQFLQLLERTQGAKLDDTGRECIEYAVGGVTRMRELVRALLDYSRIGRQALDPAPTDVDALVRGRMADLAGLVAERGAELRCRALPSAVTAEGPLLGMVFYNLMGNALKFNDRPHPVVEVWAEEAADRWTFHVRDNGIGIPPSKERQIFEPFQRLHGSESYPGTGIGLASCRKIVEHHGGRIGYTSVVGEGTDFWFTLPKRVGQVPIPVAGVVHPLAERPVPPLKALPPRRPAAGPGRAVRPKAKGDRRRDTAAVPVRRKP
jgi:PAS domain S-box-containing protein